MTENEAKQLLLVHGGCHCDPDDPRIDLGFIGSLRPYRGLNINNLHEVMAALKVLAPVLQGRQVDREIVGALWQMCELARMWGVHPDGMLRRNGLISSSDVQRLETWIDCISSATTGLLCTIPSPDAIKHAFHRYDEMA